MVLSVAVAVLCLLGSHYGDAASDVEADALLTTPELVTKYGYPVESHTVQTEDGYILTLHRIPRGKDSTDSANRPAIMVQHGLLCSSADWIIMGPEQGLGYILADAGYDVWLGNSRGNVYSSHHRDKLPASEYWDFSWHEMGIYDLPASIDYILAQTGQEKIYYAGHSMGTTMFYVMGSEKPEYNSKIRAMFSLAPIAYLSNMGSKLTKLMSQFSDVGSWVTSMLGVNQFSPSNALMKLLGQVFCRDHAISQSMCSNALFLVVGYDSLELNKTKLPAILAHTPAGSSVRQFLHYGQSAKSGRFAQYDFGFWDNAGKYGSVSPPDYDLSKITAPMVLMYSKNDQMASITDVDILASKLPNLKEKYLVEFVSFNHMDFMYAIHGKSMVYDEMLRLMPEY